MLLSLNKVLLLLSLLALLILVYVFAHTLAHGHWASILALKVTCQQENVLVPDYWTGQNSIQQFDALN